MYGVRINSWYGIRRKPSLGDGSGGCILRVHLRVHLGIYLGVHLGMYSRSVRGHFGEVIFEAS